MRFLVLDIVGGTFATVTFGFLAVFLLSGQIQGAWGALLGLAGEWGGGIQNTHVTGGGSLRQVWEAGFLRQLQETFFLTAVLVVAALAWLARSVQDVRTWGRAVLSAALWIPGPLVLWWLLLWRHPPSELIFLTLVWTALGGALLPETGQALVRLSSPERTGPAFQLVLSTKRPLGAWFPWPGTSSGWLLAAVAYRVLPELAARVPALVGVSLALDLVQNQPGLGTLALQALVGRDPVLLAAAVLGIQLLVRVSALPVQVLLFVLYPRRGSLL